MKLRAASVLLALLPFFSCTKSTPDYSKVVVLTVNGQKFLAYEFASALAKRLKTFDALAAKDATNIKRAKEATLREMVISALLTQYASENHIAVSAAEVDAEVQRVRSSYPDDLTFKASLATEGQTIEEWRSKLQLTLLQRKVFSALTPSLEKPSKADEEVARKYYEEHKSDFDRPAQIHLLQIVVPREDDAERIYHKIKSGTSFAEMAKKFSTSPDADKGGDVGYITKGVVPAFDSAFSLPVNQVSTVIKSSYGFHIMKVLDKRPAGRIPYEQVRDKLLRNLVAQKQQDAFSGWLENAMKAAKVERNDSLLDKLKVRTEGDND